MTAASVASVARRPLGRPVGQRRAALVVFATAVLVYSGSLANGFPNDDRDIVLENERIHSLSSLPEALSTPYWPIEFGADMGLWRPAATATYALEWAVFEGSPAPYHAVNIVLHGLVSVLVVLLVGALLPSPAPLTAGLLFAVHPVHVEAVAGIVGLAELGSAAAFLAACTLFLSWRDRLHAGRLVALSGLYGLSVLFKESGVVLPLALLVLDSFESDPSVEDAPRVIARRWPLWLSLAGVLAGIAVMRAAVLDGLRAPLPPVGAELLEQIPRLYTVAAIWPEYLRLLLWPWNLSGDYSPARIPLLLGWTPTALVGVSLALAGLGLAWWGWRARTRRSWARGMALGGLFTGITLITTSNLVVLSGVLLAERTLYLPSVGVCLALGAVVVALAPAPQMRRAVLAAAVVAFVVAGAIRTVARVPVWRDTETMWLDVVRQQPENGRSHWVLGDALWRTGDRPGALRAYGRAVGLLGGDQLLLTEIAQRLLEAGRPAQAEVLARQAWEKRPGYDAAPGLLAVALLAQGRSQEAIEPAQASLEADPSDPTIHLLLAQAYRASHRPVEALMRQREAIRLGGGSSASEFGAWLTLAELEGEVGNPKAVGALLDSARVHGAPLERVRQIGRDAGLVAREQGAR